MNVFLKSIKLFLIRSQEYWNLIWARAKWRNQNKHNLTVPGRLFPFKKVKVGKGTYGTLNVISYGNIEENLSIGNYCSIAGNVVFILSGEHSYDHLSTYPFQKKYMVTEMLNRYQKDRLSLMMMFGLAMDVLSCQVSKSEEGL